MRSNRSTNLFLHQMNLNTILQDFKPYDTAANPSWVEQLFVQNSTGAALLAQYHGFQCAEGYQGLLCANCKDG